MPPPRDLNPGASPAHFFGAEVRRAREAAGMTLAGLGQLVPCDVSTVSRVESALLSPTARFAAACDEAFPGMNGWFTRFYNDSRTWEDTYPKWFRDWLVVERKSSLLRIWQPLLIPGLLQTADYAQALFTTCRRSDEESVEEKVKARISRREILSRDNPPDVRVLIYEPVLRRLVGTPDVMAEQTRFLVEMACKPNITIQVMPETAGAFGGLSGACWIANVPGEPDSAYLETAVQGWIARTSAMVREASTMLDDLRDEALTRSQSLERMERVVQEWRTMSTGGAKQATVTRMAEAASRSATGRR